MNRNAVGAAVLISLGMSIAQVVYAGNPAGAAPATIAPNRGEAATRAEEARRLWAKRDDARLTATTLQAIEAWVAAAPSDPEALILLSRATYTFGFLMDRGGSPEAKHKMLSRGLEAGRKAAQLAPNQPGGDFWAATNLAALSKLNGIRNSISSRDEIVERLTRVEKRDPGYFHGGVWRFHGRLIDQLPGSIRMMIGDSLEDALAHYRKAATLAPGALITYVYMGECLQKMDRRDEARKVLETAAGGNPDQLADMAPENRYFQQRARTLLKEL